jgi:hypothetical protein
MLTMNLARTNACSKSFILKQSRVLDFVAGDRAGSGTHEDRVGQQREQQQHNACNNPKRLKSLIQTQLAAYKRVY